jgi:hypothetical protein
MSSDHELEPVPRPWGKSLVLAAFIPVVSTRRPVTADSRKAGYRFVEVRVTEP